MLLCLVLFLCVTEIYSRLVEIYSRLCGRKFPIKAITGIYSQALGLSSRFHGAEAAITGKPKKFPVRREKPGTLVTTEDWLPF
jgi:hypothetical protein